MHIREKKWYIYGSLFLFFLFLISFFLGVFKTQCEDESCFQDAAALCSPKIYEKSVNNNIYRYVISRSFGDMCRIKISLEKTSIGTEFENKLILEGKSMDCYISKSKLIEVNFNEIENLLGYCSGPLKEGIYEIMIKKMYGVIISNLGDILGELQLSLIQKI
jgi:hypothetical protein